MHTTRPSGKLKAVIRVAVTMAAGCSAVVGSACWAQSGTDAASGYPNRPIRLIVPFPPGTATDITARSLAPRLSEALGQQVIADNRGGAGGRLGTEIGSRATPDGYTLILSGTGPFSIAPALYPNLPYDVLRDFEPITNLVTQAQVLLTNPSLPMKTVADVVQYVRARPGAVNYASIGAGSLTHLAMEMVQSATKIKLTHVAFNGSGPAQIGLMSGQVQLTIDTLPAIQPILKSGKLRAIAVTTLERQKIAPEIPTMAESGYPGFEALGWGGVSAPAKTPVPILEKLNRELTRILNSAEVRDRFTALGYNPAPLTRAQYREFIHSEIEKWRKVTREAGIKMQD